jgi:tetratricopeptide (TPR) repeat protein
MPSFYQIMNSLTEHGHSVQNNLGLLYSDQGKLDEAEKMYQRAFEGFEKALGPEHISTLLAVNNLGSLDRDQGKLDEAEQMYERAFEGFKNALGVEHTSTLCMVNNLGLVYGDRAMDSASISLEFRGRSTRGTGRHCGKTTGRRSVSQS